MAVDDRAIQDPSGPSRDEFLPTLRAADPTLLLNCLIDLTGDSSILATSAGEFSPLSVRSAFHSHEFESAAESVESW